MRWIKRKHNIQDTIRSRTAFLFLPKTMSNIDNEEETRWLEKASWYEEFLGFGEANPNHEYWVARRWFGEEE